MTTLDTTPEERARKRAKDFTGLIWHITAFVIVNGFLWILDLVTGDGIGWAYWVTISWGVGLTFHIIAYVVDRSGLEQRRYERYLEEERRRETTAS